MSKEHIPVLLEHVLAQAGEVPKIDSYLDCTFGRGGHARAIQSLNPKMKICVFDRDSQAIDYGQMEWQKELLNDDIFFYHENFMTYDLEKLAIKSFDFILADLGVSSPQYDQAERGFSFYEDGPLDMRMDHRDSFHAANIINEYSELELLRVFREYGEHPNPRRVIRAILADREKKPFSRTSELSGLIERVDGWRKKGSHPATKYFMGLRLEVNQELTPLKDSIDRLVQSLSNEGRLAIISFHSLEDRIIKHHFKTLGNFGTIINKKVICASDEEIKGNPRSRTAKLRVFKREINENS